MWYSAVGCLVMLTLSLVAAPLAADAQPFAKVARIGYLSPGGGTGSPLAEAFRQGLRELGYVEGQNIAIDFRTAEGKSNQLAALAGELVQLSVDVIVAFTSLAAQAAKHTTTTIPIVMVSSGDPVGTGLVASLARLGGNITGLTRLATELSGKQLELLREAVPSLARLAVLWNARDTAMTHTFRGIEAAAAALGVTVHPLRRQVKPQSLAAARVQDGQSTNRIPPAPPEAGVAAGAGVAVRPTPAGRWAPRGAASSAHRYCAGPPRPAAAARGATTWRCASDPTRATAHPASAAGAGRA